MFRKLIGFFKKPKQGHSLQIRNSQGQIVMEIQKNGSIKADNVIISNAKIQ